MDVKLLELKVFVVQEVWKLTDLTIVDRQERFEMFLLNFTFKTFSGSV